MILLLGCKELGQSKNPKSPINRSDIANSNNDMHKKIPRFAITGYFQYILLL